MPDPQAQSTTAAPRAPVPIRRELPIGAFVGVGCVGVAFVQFRRVVSSADLTLGERTELAMFLESFAREVRRG